MDITIYVGEEYEDSAPKVPAGWTLFVEGVVDTNIAGAYTITYTARENASGRVIKTSRTVTVVEAPAQIGSITLSGDPVITVSLPDVASYVDAGATSPDGTVLVTNLDGTASESFTGLPNIAGSYTLIYYLSGSLSNFVTRTIHVSDPNSGGGGGGVSAPASGPTGLDASIVSTPPASGPTNLLANLEAEPVKPAIGYPITSSDGTSLAIKPAVGYPIVGKPVTGYPITSVGM